MLNSWPLGIAPVHRRVGEGVRLLWRKQIVWLWTACGRNTAERRKPLKSMLHGCRATILFCIMINILHNSFVREACLILCLYLVYKLQHVLTGNKYWLPVGNSKTSPSSSTDISLRQCIHLCRSDGRDQSLTGMVHRDTTEQECSTQCDVKQAALTPIK